jgi:probable HAF family extracellular repeat protein
MCAHSAASGTCGVGRSRLPFMLLAAIATLGLAAPAAGRPAAQTPTYAEVVDLGVFPGGGLSQASAVNAGVVVVGSASIDPSNSILHAALYRDGKLTDLGPEGEHSYAVDVNKSRRSVGVTVPIDAAGAADWSRPRATAWYKGEATELESLGGEWSMANGINDRGHIVGESTLESGGAEVPTHAVLWRQDELIDLGTLGDGEASTAVDINDAGQVVGASTTAPGQQLYGPGTHAFLWDDGVMTDLGTLGEGEISFANAINDAGQIVGSSTTSPDQPTIYGDGTHAVIWYDGVATDLGAFEAGGFSTAVDINEAGTVIGYATTEPGQFQAFGHAVIWQDGELLDLNALIPADGWVLNQAFGINDGGFVVGMGRSPAGQPRGFLLIPATN